MHINTDDYACIQLAIAVRQGILVRKSFRAFFSPKTAPEMLDIKVIVRKDRQETNNF